MRPLCRDLAARGWTAWNVEYRRLGRVSGGGWPTTFDGRRRGDRPPGRDPHATRGWTSARVVAIGHSAGGHLAAWAAARPGLPEGAPGAAPRVRGDGRGLAGRRRRPAAGVGAAALQRRRRRPARRRAGGVRRRATRSPRRPSACRSACRCCSPTAARDDIVPPSVSASLRRGRAGGGRRGRARRARRRGPLRPHRPGEPAVGGRGANGWRDRPRARRGARRRRPARGVPRRASSSATSATSTSTATRSAGCPLATRERLPRRSSEWGPRLVARLARVDRPAAARRRRARRRCSAPRPARWSRRDSTTVNLYKLVPRGARRARRRRAGHRPRQLPDRPLRARGDRRARAALELRLFDTDELDGPVPADLGRVRARRRRRALARRLPLGRAGRHGGADGRGARARRDADLGPLALRRRGAGRPARRGRRAGGRLHLQVPQRRAGRARATCTSRAELQAALRSPIWGWFGQRDQFAMERDYDPVPGIGRFLAGTPPILQLAAVEEGARLTAEAGHRRDPREVRRADRADRRAARRVAGAARLRARLAARPGPPRLARLAAPPAGVAVHPRADRGAGVTPDFRGPDSIRLGVAPLYTSFVEVWDALDRLRAIARARRAPRSTPRRARRHLDDVLP